MFLYGKLSFYAYLLFYVYLLKLYIYFSGRRGLLNFKVCFTDTLKASAFLEDNVESKFGICKAI